MVSLRSGPRMDEQIRLLKFVSALMPPNALAAVAVAIVLMMLWSLGRLVSKESAANATLLGWAILYLACLTAACMGLQDLRLVLAPLLIVSVVGLLRRLSGWRPTLQFFMPLCAILPLIGSGLLIPVVHWDSFSHWVLNASYVYRTHHFPAVPLEGFPSYHPDYPEASSLVFVAASSLAGRFLETSGTFLKIGLTLLALISVREMIEATWTLNRARDRAPVLTRRLGSTTVAFCIVLSLNPSYRAQNFFSAMVDPAVGLVVLFVVLLFCRLVLDASAADSVVDQPWPTHGPGDARGVSWIVLFMFGVLLSGLKDSSWILGAVLTLSVTLTAARFSIPLRRLAPILLFLLGSIVGQSLWAHYLHVHLPIVPIAGRIVIHPLTEWRWDLVPALLHGVVADVRQFPGYYALLSTTVAAGVLTFFRPGLVRDRRLGFVLATIALAMMGHFVTVLSAYLGTGNFFSDAEISRAASLHRYSSHVGYATCVVGMLAIGSFVVRHVRPLLARTGRARNAIVFTIAALVYAGSLVQNVARDAYFEVKFAMLFQVPRQAFATEVLRDIPSDSRFAVFSSFWVENFVQYAAWNPGGSRSGPIMIGQSIIESEADLPRARRELSIWMAQDSVDYMVLADARLLNVALGLPADATMLWSRTTGIWQELPVRPGYR